ncbi:hypothetical protein [Flavihumibacter fluvii]|uniref:hypothetical protein n=1 Tax=Flavihumibacter fluvii TaxID=2838157 RepID=UPI001BDE1715|nr:hypothetical protein [Flavihumibacter fluvii]ULQ50695.1 hypothetical protein KJS93_11445 [Flavihumibacter fluvii]
MKSVNTKLKAMLSVAAVAAVMVLSTGTANANNEKTGVERSVIPVEVKYIGSQNEQPVLEVSLDNAAGEEFKVTLRDENGELLYSGSFTNKKIVKRFQFDNGSDNPMRILLTVSTKKLSQTETFEISKNRQVIEDVVIEKL